MKYSVPDYIRKYRPENTMVKVINCKYYVYEYKCFKNDEGKWKTKMGKVVGKITKEDGFIPNDNYIYDSQITTLEYGQYAVVVSNSKRIIKDLLDVFNPEDAYVIYFLSVIHVVNGFQYLKNIKDLIEQSYISLLKPNLSFSYETLIKILDSLGRKQEKVFEYEQKCIDGSSKKIIIDGHVMSSASNNNDLAEYGNKYSSLDESQINVLMVYDLENNIPLTSRVYSGSTLDKVSIKDMLNIHKFANVLFVLDRGFYSEKNINLFSSNGNHYIIPLSQNLKDYKEAVEDLKLHDMFIYEGNKKRTSIEYKEIIKNDKRIIVYRDNEQYLRDNQDYIKNMERDPKKYTKEKYSEVKDFFGIIVLETNLEKEAEKIYELYKKRWKIETYFNYFKNKISIETTNVNDYYKTQGLGFIMLIVSQVFEEVRKNTSSVKGKNLYDILRESKFLKLHKRKEIWKVENVKKQLVGLMNDVNVDIANPLILK